MPVIRTHSVLLMLLACAAPSLAAEGGLSPAIVTGQASFTIPYDMPAPSADAPPPVEVQLHVSTDLGVTWRLAQRQDPAVGQFEFTPTADGEHWFSIRGIDAAGQAHPAGAPQPEMQVIVDRGAPDVRLSAQRVSPGVVIVRWYVTDRHTALDRFTIAYRSEQQGPVWKTKEFLTAGAASGNFPLLQGEAPLEIDAHAEALLLRGEAADAVGNIGTHEIRLEAPAAAMPREELTPARKPPGAAASGRIHGAADVAAVNSRRFELEYQVDHVGPEGVGEVEVWGTRDGGKAWVRLGVDDDRRSPCPVVVDRDGLYGFAIVVHSAGGLQGVAPQPGALPEAWVRVDTAPPTARLTTAEQVYDSVGAALTVHWQASDADLAEQPISLSYAQSAAGPWIPLATDLQNAGEHLCRFTSDVGREVYLKVDVRDLAGNVGSFTTTRPLRLETNQAATHATTHEGTTEVRSARLLHVLR